MLATELYVSTIIDNKTGKAATAEEIIDATQSPPPFRYHIGFFDYNDEGTSTSPIMVLGNMADTLLTNDTLGTFTNTTYAPQGVTSVWDEISNSFDWTQLSLGDTVEIRLDVEVTTTSPNQLIEVDLNLGGGGGEYSIPFISETEKSTGLHKLNRFNGIYIGDTNTLSNPGNFFIRSDANASVRVNGWYVKVTTKA